MQEPLAVDDDILGEDRDVAVEGLEVLGAEQGGADVDGRAAVDDLGYEDPSCVRRDRVRVTPCGD
ncbi:hypothetical protein [Streptomyces cinereospinus]|uniref:Uncharacterized protein n=1 Tax=Streptomyces cinereospinus TaxID=285561 RepID=A0ABV5MXQ3_9ACTN